MAAQLLQTDLSLFWGLLRVSAKLKSPPQQTLTNGNASTEALIPLNNGQPTAAAEASSPASAAHTDEQTLVERKFSISVGTEMGAEDVSSVQPITSSPAQALGIHESQHAKLPEEVIPSQKRQPKSKRSVSSSTRPASSLSGMKEGTEAQLSRQSAQEKAAFDSFRSLCAAKGLLKSPIGIGSKDVPEGINDDATLLYASLMKELGWLAPFRPFRVTRLTVRADDSSMPENKTSETRIDSSPKPVERVM